MSNILRLTKLQRKGNKYLKYVFLHEDGETILIKHLREEFILLKFEVREQDLT